VGRILVVDDEPRMSEVVARALAKRGHEVRTAGDGSEALRLLEEEPADLVFTDQRMQPTDGMELLRTIRDRYPDTRVVMMTAYGEVSHAVAAMKAGASHYLNKPIDLEELQLLAERLLAERELERDNVRLRQVLVRQGPESDLRGASDAMRRVAELIQRVAPTEATVLIRGESGTGKELTARSIHRQSSRHGGPFVAVNCAAIPDSLLESELFGYVKGAFTGADSDKAGLFELANKGTIFLDEIGEANAGVQAKLLRALEERKFIPVGGRREVEVDIRILAATHRDLEKLIAEGAFREDLYYRFNVFPVDLPPLRDRLEDLDVLARHFLTQLGRPSEHLSPAILAQLRTYPWPGNIRELRNIIERAHILAGPVPIGVEHILLPESRQHRGDAAEPVDLNLDAHEKRLIGLALRRAGGNKTRAAQMLGLTRRALYSRMERLDIPIDTEGGHGD
jgi:two-component system response regulator AtoC